MKTEKGTVRAWVEEVAIPYEGDDCLLFPFHRARSGHARISARQGGSTLVHVRIAERIHGPKPTAKHECCHSCGNGHLGCVAPRHLYWGTRKQNVADRKKHGVFVPPPMWFGEASSRAILTDAQVREIKSRLRGSETMKAIAAAYGVSIGAIGGIKYGRHWTHIEG